MLSTLGDVVEELSPGTSIERVVAEYALTHGLPIPFFSRVRKPKFRLPLKGPDLLAIGLSGQSLLPRVWAQSVRSILRIFMLWLSQQARCNDRPCPIGPIVTLSEMGVKAPHPGSNMTEEQPD